MSARSWQLSLWLLVGAIAGGCSEKVISSACLTDIDCPAGNVCESGRCVAADGGQRDGGGSDAGEADSGFDAGPADSGFDAGQRDAGPFDGGDLSNPCSLSGSWIHDSTGMYVIGSDPADASGAPSGARNAYPGFWLGIPEGFCAHHFATVPNARQMRFAPGGELFVTSPNTPTTGGTAGLSAIVVLPDDDQDGVADSVITYKSNLPATQGIMFANGEFYYQDTPPADGGSSARAGTRIVKQPYAVGQRQDVGQAVPVVNITSYVSALHWPKTLDISDTGRIFVGNGGDQNEACVMPMPFHGGIVEVDGTTGGNEIVKGLRNPIDVKCHRDGHDICYATELSRDYSASQNGRERLLVIKAGDNWGFPCCAAQDAPFPDMCLACGSGAVSSSDSSAYCKSQSLCSPDCGDVVPDTNSFLIGDTPFGFDFIDNQFPSPWDHKVMVALHGAFATWVGARVVAIDFDPATGLTYPSSTTDGGQNSGHISDFLTGYDNGLRLHGRPADIAIAPDGRLFVANDVNGEIFWIAPLQP